MKSGDIILFRAEKKPLSRLIAWGTESTYSHVAVCVSAELDIAIEAMTKGGVRARAISEIEEPVDFYRIRGENKVNLRKTIAFLVKQLNNRYDYLGVIYLGFMKLAAKVLGSVVWKNKANKWQKEKDYFCSELCYEAFSFGGLDIVPEVGQADITSPGDIARSSVIEKVVGE